MSASLVGSEMCIRDRARRGFDLRKTWCRLSRALQRIHIHLSQVLPIPVSYTHLTLPTICSV
eukprot:7759879-Alexandrium_andersonii.AAC.1